MHTETWQQYLISKDQTFIPLWNKLLISVHNLQEPEVFIPVIQWDTEQHYLSIAITDEGNYEWFFNVKPTDVMHTGYLGKDDKLTVQLLEKLQYFT